jgi:hypothetical protein
MNIYFIAAAALAIIVILSLFWSIIRLHSRVSAFTGGANGASLESTMKKLLKDHDEQIRQHAELVAFVESIDARLADSHRGFAITRYNAFEHTGGNQSFCCAFLDERGNGMVLSSIYSRERSNVFAKPIHKFSTDLELSDEEKKVLKQAVANMK